MEADGLISDCHIGNMFTTISVPQLTEDTDFERTSAGHLAMPDATMEEIADKALEIRTQLEEVDREYILQRLAVLSSLEKPTKASIAAQRACKATVGGIKFGSLVGFGADIDFGIPGTAEGRPRWCRKPWMHDEGMINILPRRGGTGGDAPWEILVCLPKGIIKAMLKWTEFGQFVDRRVNDGDALDHVRHQAKPFCRRLLYLDSETTRMIDTSNDWSGGDGKC